MSLDPTLEARSPYGWDWTATTHDALGTDVTVRGVVEDMTSTLGGVHVIPTGKGIHGWSDSVDVFDCDGYRLGRVYFCSGPRPARTDVFVVSTSSAADLVRDDVVGTFLGSEEDPDALRYRAKTARVDTRVDSLVPFDDLAAIMEEAAEGYGSLITRVESSQRGESLGRTLYLGAPSSAIRVRLYEKWLESPGQYVAGTNRVEVQLRPASKVKERVSTWTRAQTFCASRVTRSLAERLGADLEPVASLHVNRGTPDLERSLEAMGEQYGKAAARWLDLSQGDVSTLLDYLTVKVPAALPA